MREILFRGKRIDNGEWVAGDLIQLHDGRKYIVNNVHGACIDDNGNFINTEAPFVCPVVPATVGQYTGMKDKNGKKIFECNIVQMSDGKCGIIVYDDRCAGYGLGLHGDGCWLCVSEEKDRLVIGNIHDNPELLKGGE